MSPRRNADPLTKQFDFSRARRITPAEVEENRQRIKMLTGRLPRRRRPGPAPTPAPEKYRPISIRIHPLALAWARKEAKKRGVGYQTVINEVILQKAERPSRPNATSRPKA